MKTLNKALIFGLSAIALTGCSLNFGGEGGVTTSLTRAQFIEEGEKLGNKAKDKIESINKLTIKITNEVSGKDTTTNTMVGNRGEIGWVCENADSETQITFAAKALQWETDNVPLLASVMKDYSTKYKDYTFEKSITGGYVMKDKYDTFTFDSNGVMTKHTFEAYKGTSMETKTTTEYSF